MAPRPCISARPSPLAQKTAIGFRQRRARASTSCSAFTARSKHFSQSSGGQARSNWRSERRNRTRSGSMKTIGIRILLTAALAGAPALPAFAQTPASITTPDRLETRLGTLEFKDGAPSMESVQKVYDNLDFMHGVEAFVNAFQGA